MQVERDNLKGDAVEMSHKLDDELQVNCLRIRLRITHRLRNSLELNWMKNFKE